MNLALHGFLLQVILSIINYQYGFQVCSAVEPGYLDFDNLPETNFSCQGKVIGGYYADVEAGCQMFHVCTIGQKDEIMDIKFLCLNGTVFDQETRVCERVDEVDCSKSERFYNLNLELYGNNAVTLSLHENEDDADESPILIEDHQGTTSARPSTMTTTTTTQRPTVISSTTAASGPYQHPNGYPQHYQPQPPFPSIQTSQSKSLYDDKNGGYHRQYIYHIESNNEQNNGNQNDDNRATSYQIFSNQGQSSTTGAPQIHQIHYSSTSSPSTAPPIFHATSSTIQTLLSANNPTLINPIFHNNGISSTTEHFNVHSNAPRETSNYQQNHNTNDGMHRQSDNHQGDRQFLTPIQPTNQGKISKLAISPVPIQHEIERTKQQSKDDIQTVSQSQQAATLNQQQNRITGSFLTIASTGNGSPTVRSFYPTPKATSSSKSQSSTTTHITQHIHIIPPFMIPQLKPHQVTINLPPPDIQRIVQNPSPLLPTQSRVIVTAKASVSDESGRPLNSTQLVTLPLPTVPASYDDYKEGDESFDPFYRDVPKIRNTRRSYWGRGTSYYGDSRKKRSIDSQKNVAVNAEIIHDSMKKIVDVEKLQETPTTPDINEENVSDDIIDVDQVTTTQIPDDEAEYDNGVGTTEKEIVDDDNKKFYSDEQLYDNVSSDETETSDYDNEKFNSNEQRYDNISSDEFLSKEINFDYQNESDELKINDSDYINYDEYSELSAEINNTSEIETTTQSIDNNETTELIIDANDEIDKSLNDELDNITTENPTTLQIPSSNLSNNMTQDSHIENSDEALNEGILIFTDEIPQTEVKDKSQSNDDDDADDDERIESVSAHPNLFDYVDDNYEPENYHEKKSIESSGDDEKKMEIINSMNGSVGSEENYTTDTFITTTPIITTTSSAPSTSTSSTTLSTTLSTTISTTPITTTSSTTSTTTPRIKPTSIKLFKYMTTRRHFVYIPPTTTPLPVKIKSRLSLYNPNPTKPPKSYNELAPKPVIRKISLNARKVLSTTSIRNNLNDVPEFTTPHTTETTLQNNQIPNSTPVAEQSTISRSFEKITKEPMDEIIDVTTEATTLKQVEAIGEMSRIVEHTSTEKVADVIIITPEPPKKVSTTISYDNMKIGTPTLNTIRPMSRKTISIHKRNNAFICPKDLELKRFYADKRDCRLFHYCSYGYSSQQILDFRFVCEEGTMFDEESQSCVYHTENTKCLKRIW
ncbi:hypothetical protein PV328_000355 [Microctonus aethiopoides]|uniref:Chitin-binding type-2 domain-containing protein n=1 Tax=Microctonus aethiopoides TaxID=144406 RepID=A0AA39FUQ9_9HYME|nr:hypothetical protein PV328_000355 [Microctonus aethiopoides]